MGDTKGVGSQTADRRAAEGQHVHLVRRFSAAVERTATMTRDMAEDISELLDVQEEVGIEDIRRSAPDDGSKEALQQTKHRDSDLLDPERIMLRDKLVFFTGVVNIV